MEKASKLIISLESGDCNLLDRTIKIFINTAKKNKAIIQGPIPLKTKLKPLICYKRVMEISNADDKIIKNISLIDIPQVIDINLKIK